MTGAALTAAELARRLGVSRARVSQYLAQGRLEGAYTGSGRDRRFDAVTAARLLQRTLDPAQMLGNGIDTARRLREIATAADAHAREAPSTAAPPARQTPLRPAPGMDGTELVVGDLDRYELARTQKAEEEARRLRRQNLEAEGTYVLASAVDAQVARVLAQEIAEMEAALRDGARRVADALGVDFKAVRRHLLDAWRAHRARRAEALGAEAAAATLTADEAAADV